MQSCRKATTRISAWPTTDRWVMGIVVVALLALTSWLLPTGHAAEPAPLRPDDVAVFMRAKLDHSSEVLEGLSLADFEKIRRGGQLLALASQASSWQVLQSEEYARQSVAFRRACERLERAATEKNLDAAALAWMDVTMKCVQCHRYVRDQPGR
jgi:hypothetical protein